MKKFFKSLIILVFLALVTVSISSFAKRSPGTNNGTPNVGITYVVVVTPPESNFCDSYHVIIRDEQGNMIASPLEYFQGIDNYIFHEAGTILGTRIAYLEKQESSGYSSCQRTLHTNPDELTGKFHSGSMYLFKLYPVISLGYE